jgi:acyl-homoserine-lactone acylase
MGGAFANAKGYSEGIADLLAWDGALTKGSTGALKYYYWRAQLYEDYGPDVVGMVEGRVDDWYHVVEDRDPKPIDMSDEELGAGLSAFANAMARMQKHFGRLNVKYGEKFRVGRDHYSWPVGGGGDNSTSTLRSVRYAKEERRDHTRWGVAGQTSTQVVVLTKPIRSWIYIPIGESDDRDSPHYADQAEKLFSNRTLKSSWWLPEDLADHIESRTVLENAPKG